MTQPAETASKIRAAGASSFRFPALCKIRTIPDARIASRNFSSINVIPLTEFGAQSHRSYSEYSAGSMDVMHSQFNLLHASSNRLDQAYSPRPLHKTTILPFHSTFFFGIIFSVWSE